MHSISDLTTYCRKTSGDVPSRLVGASTTVVGSKMFLFGGRLVTERKMVSDMYVFDLETFIWEKLPPSPEEEVPGARYFHSADIWNNHLIICGGMGHKAESGSHEDLRVLNDVRFFNLATRRWLPAALTNSAPDPADFRVPKARYAHLSSITADRLFIIGGQDLSNIWLDDVHVYDLLGKTWVERRNYPRHVGTYRSIAVAAEKHVRLPQDELRASQSTSTLGPPGTRFRTDNAVPSSPQVTQSDSLIHLPYTAPATDEYPNDIYLYSNYNFTDVKREFEVFSPLPDTDFTINDRSAAMVGASFPPGLRFPSGAMLGTHFIIGGTYIAHTYQSFSIWALDLLTMQWSRIDPGGAVSTGSWFRGCLWADANKFLIFGNRNGNLVEDYNRRLLSWDHVAVIDLESFGIYQPPPLKLDIPMQELGLAALEEGVLTDFEIICDDGRKIKCSRKILEERWPWFKEQRQKFLQTAKEAVESLSTSTMHVGLPELPGIADTSTPRPDPRLTPRSFQLSEPYPITLALLQYFYSLALITPLQQAPAVLSQLLVLSSTYEITHLESLVKHAMHRMLSNSTSVGVYEVATLCSCRSLQIRALKTVMSYSQKRPSGRSRQDSKTGGGGTGGAGRHPDGGSNGGHDDSSTATARPRGTSDAQFRGAADPQSSTIASGSGYMAIQRHTNQSNFISAKLKEPTSKATNRMASVSSGRQQTPSATSMSQQPRASTLHNRNLSVISTSADQELCAVAQLMSRVVVGPFAEEQELLGVALEDEFEDFIEPSIHHELESAARTKKVNRYADSEPSPYPPPSPTRSSLYPPSSSSRNSMYSDSELDHTSDSEPAHLPKAAAYPAFHLPRPRRQHVSIRDSDTPSLSSSTSFSSLSSVSRSQSRRNSPPSSPASLVTPIEYQSALPAHLAIIEERNVEDQEIPYRLSIESSGNVTAITFAVPQSSSVPSKKTEDIQYDIPTLRQRVPHHDHLRINTMSPPRRSRSQSPSLSPTVSSDSGHFSPVAPQIDSFTKQRSGSTISFTRFMGGKGKSEKTVAKMDRDVGLRSAQSPAASVLSVATTGTKEQAKQRKAEEKQRKKAEAKAKTERLAIELKEKARQRAEAQEKAASLHSSRSGDRRPIWAEGPSMYGSLGTL